MTTFDYFLNVGLVGLVVLQLRGRRLDRRALVLPLALVAWAASHYVRGIPTAGNDLVLVVGGTVAGLTLGCLSAVLTRIYPDGDGQPLARATAVAAWLWVVGIGGRMAFVLYVQHGGRPTVAQFSAAHHLTGQAWVTGLVLMAFAEVVSRTLLLWRRSHELRITSALALAATGQVSLVVVGTPRLLAPAVGLALLRASQEAVTNARKHAPGTAITITLSFDAHAATVVVDNTTVPTRPIGAAVSGGYGLRGMQERLELLGGSVTAGHTATGWQVHAWVPT